MDDLKRIIYGVLAGFLILMVVWLSFLFVSGCGFDLHCRKAATVERTPIPTLLPATMPAAGSDSGTAASAPKCQIAAVDLFAAWIDAGYPESAAFNFTDMKGRSCQATFADVEAVFGEANLWYPGAPACTTCHHANVMASLAQMDLSSYAGVTAGSRRTSETATGNDILGGGVWESSKLFEVLITRKGQPLAMPFGRPVDLDASTVIVYAGTPVADAVTPTPAP
jgi:hypothetical protein